MINPRLWHLATMQRRWLALAMGLSLAGGLLIIAQAFTLTRVIDGAFLGHQSLPALAGVLALFVVIALARAALAYASEGTAAMLSSAVKRDTRRRLFRHLLALGPAFLRGEQSGEVATTAVQGIEQLEEYYSQYLPLVLVAALLPVAIVLIVLPIDPLSAVILILTVPMIPLLMAVIGWRTAAVTEQQWQAMSRLGAHFLDVLQGMATLKLFGRSRHQIAILERIGEDLRRATMRVLRVAFLSALALEIVAALSTAIVAVEVGLRLLYGQIPFAHAFFVLLLAPEFYTPLRMLSQRYHAALPGVTASQRIFALLETPVTEQPVAGGVPAPQSVQSIALRHVTYCYPGADRPALRDLSMTLRAGEHAVIVGASGAGKSTLARLLLQFDVPTAGEILVNETPLATIASESWRDRVAWASARPHPFHRTIRDYLRMGSPNAPLNEMYAASAQAQATEFIERLPQGFDTLLGEGGRDLSGGQMQRLALARALLRHAPVLLLDEALSHLDPWQEMRILESLRVTHADVLVIIIAHRLETVRYADRVIALDEGRVVGDGTPQELLATCMPYRRLAQEEALA
jgi:ATP-binding cassette, subfamily C, bacterial CydD